MSTVIRAGWLIVAFLIAILRVDGTTHIWFQAIAHIVTGGWFGAWAMGRTYITRGEDDGPRYYLALGLGVTLVEFSAFLLGVSRFNGR